MGRSAAYDPTLDYVAIRRNVRRLANDQGRTLERLSVAADLGRHTARKVAAGTVTPTPVTIAKLAHALGVTLADLQAPCAEAEDESRGPCQLARVSALWCMTKCPNAYQVPDGCREYCKPMLGDFNECKTLDCKGCPCLEGPSAEVRAEFAKWQQARGKR